MSLELVDIALASQAPHPRLHNRVNGKVRAVLSEDMDGRALQHEIFVPVWVDRHPDMSDDDLELALLVKAADIVGKLKMRLAGPPPQPVSPDDPGRDGDA